MKLVVAFFSSEMFQHHHSNFQSTGVVPLNSIRKYLHKYNPKMVAGLLSHLKFCSLIEDPEVCHLIAKEHRVSGSEKYYFFLDLVKVSVWKNPFESNKILKI